MSESATAAPRPGAASPVVSLADVRYAVNGRAIFDDLTIEIERGKVTAIMGPSGTGKTTLLRLITGQLRASAGKVVVEGQDLAALDRDGLYRLRRGMGMLFQNGALLTDLDVYENVAFPLREHTRLPESLISRIVLMKLHAVGLRGAVRLRPGELSGGMARRVALARSIVMDPKLLIYDEPFAGLDPISLGVIGQLIRRLNDALGITSVVVTHDVYESLKIVDYLYFVSEGRIVASGTTAEVRQSMLPFVRQFVDGQPDGPVPFHYPALPYREELFARVD